MTEDLRLRVSENMALGDIYWPKRDALTADWRILHNEQLHDLYSLFGFSTSLHKKQRT
jgi:hypothetical protein